MAVASRTTLKTYFETGDRPTSTQFGDLIDSFVSMNDADTSPTVLGAKTFSGAVTFSSTVAITGNTTLTGDLAVNGGDLTSTATTFNLLNATVTTLNIGGGATVIGLGAASTVITLGSNATINGGSAANDDLTLQGTSHATRTTSYVILQPTSGLVGIRTTTPVAELDVNGKLRTTGTSALASGTGLEIYYNSGTSVAGLIAYDRTAGAYKEINYDGLKHLFYASGGGTTTGIGINIAPTKLLELAADSAQKPTTDTWTITSDARMKDKTKEKPYLGGMAWLKTLPPPIYFTYNGIAGTPAGEEGIGWNAQDLLTVAPRMVHTAKGKLSPAPTKGKDKDGKVILIPPPKDVIDALPEIELLGVNMHEMRFAMLNAILELDSRLTALEKKP